jgi:hypothetical protein
MPDSLEAERSAPEPGNPGLLESTGSIAQEVEGGGGPRMSLLLLIVVILLLVGALPLYSYSSSWGYYPSGGLGLVLLVLVVLLLLGRI